MKEPRPDIPKLKIDNIGEFDSDGKPIFWAFDGASHPQSVGEYFSEGWHLIGGYTIDELMEIKTKEVVDDLEVVE